MALPSPVITLQSNTAGTTQLFDDIPVALLLPPLTTRSLDAADTLTSVNASAQIKAAFTAGSILVYINGVQQGVMPFVAPDAPRDLTGIVIEVETVPGGFTLQLTDIPAPLTIPALTRHTVTGGLNTPASIVVSIVLAAALTAGVVRVYADGVQVNLLTDIGAPQASFRRTATVFPLVNVSGPSAESVTPSTTLTAIVQGTFVPNEVPVGTVNGINNRFTLAFKPLATGLFMLEVSGLLMKRGALNYFNLIGNVITFNAGAIPQSGEQLLCTYQFGALAPGGATPDGFDPSGRPIFRKYGAPLDN